MLSLIPPLSPSLFHLYTPPPPPPLYPKQKVQRLLKELENHDARNTDGDTLLHTYVRRQDKHKKDCLLALLMYGSCDVDGSNKQGFTPLHIAAEVSFLR